MPRPDVSPGEIRRQVRSLSRIARALVERAAALPDGEPGLLVFPKHLFRTDSGSPPNPDGRSLAYLQLAETFWRRRLATDAPDDDEALRLVHEAVREAHVLERTLQDRLRDQP